MKSMDAIARQLKRDIVVILFFNPGEPTEPGSGIDVYDIDWTVDWENHPGRAMIIEWLDFNKFHWRNCGMVANEFVLPPYRGEIYVDIPHDKQLETYQRLEALMENTDGTTRIPGAKLCFLTHEVAMKNAHHDEPGFWDKWADNF